MKQAWMQILIGTLLAVSLPQAAGAATQTLRLAVPWSPGSKGLADLKTAARRISKQTDDRVRLKFVEQHELDTGDSLCAGGLLTGAALARISPDSRLFSLPLLFRSVEEVTSLQAELDEDIRAALTERGFVTLTQLNMGFAYIHSRRPIEGVGDLKAVQLWVPPGEEESLQIARSFGMTPTPMEVSAVRAGLREGSVDAAIVPPLGAILLQWHTEFKFVADTPFVCLYAVVVLKEEALAALEKPDQVVLRDELAQTFQLITEELRQKEQEALVVLEKNGVARQPLGHAPEEWQEWNVWAASVADRLILEGLVPSVGLAKTRRVLAASRGEP